VALELAGRLQLGRVALAESWTRARGLPRAAYGMTLAHLGVAALVLGITVSETWQDEVQRVMTPGETAQVGGYDVTFVDVRQVPGPNYTARRGTFAVTRAGEPVRVMQPEVRTFTNPPMDTTEAAIRPTLAADLYVVLGEPDGKGGFAVRMYHKPLVVWIWLGAVIMFLGGLVSLSDRRHRIGAPRRASRRTRSPPAMAQPAGAGDD